MSAQQLIHAPVRLLIAETSETSAQEYDSMLRDAGIATRLLLTDLGRAVTDITTTDIMLCNSSLPGLDLVLPQLALKAPHVPIILVNPKGSDPGNAVRVADGMLLGAADVVGADDPTAFVLVFKRELARACQGQRLLEARRSLTEVEQRCQLLLTSSRAAIAYVHEGMHIHANQGYLQLFGFTDAEALLGLPLMDLLSKDSAEALKIETKRLRLDADERTLVFSGVTATGEPISGVMTLAISNYEGERCVQVTVRPPVADIGPSASAPSEEIPADAPTATGFAVAGPAPAGVQAFLDAAAATPVKGRHSAILIAQVDSFAKLQEALGLKPAEAVGQRIYEAFAQNLTGGACTRLSPYQFAFVAAASDRSHLLEHLESLRRAAEAPPQSSSDSDMRATSSIGGAELGPSQGADPQLEKLLDVAFAAVLRGEAAGGNRLEVVPGKAQSSGEGHASGKTLEQINDAIENDRFQLLFQPIISLRGEAEEHYEVFLRMLDDDGRHSAPNEFLGTAVAHGVAAKIDRWVILQSVKVLAGHRARGHGTRLTITVTANSVSDPEFPQWLGIAMKAARLPSDALIFQVTEQDAAAHLRETREFFTSLKAMHCRSSLSRFGLIDQPLELLRHMPVDFVKLDGSHVGLLAEDARRKDQIAQTIRDLQAIGKLTVIPMVESAGALSALWQAGANYIQGHYLQEPTPEMDFDFSSDD